MTGALDELIARANAAFDALTPEQQAEHRRLQRESYVRAELSWPKANYHWENGVKVYHSFEDYRND
jgi:hypothetical protein